MSDTKDMCITGRTRGNRCIDTIYAHSTEVLIMMSSFVASMSRMCPMSSTDVHDSVTRNEDDSCRFRFLTGLDDAM